VGLQTDRATRSRSLIGLVIALITLGSGLLNVYSVIGPSLPERHAILRTVFPLEFLHLSRFVTLLLGFTLVILSINIYRRKKRAMVLGIALSALSAVFHLTKGLDYEEALLSVILLVALIFARKEFRVRSGVPNFADAITKLSVAVALTLGYGILGFWLLDHRQFGIDFSFIQAILSTGSLLIFSPRPYLVPHTAYARWFLESFYLITLTAIVYAGVELFRPGRG
jgi:phosphatidylglycerol lysyltransferase